MDKFADDRPVLHSGSLTNPPAALQPLIERPQWAIWRLTWTGTRWSKPPFQAGAPQRHASSTDAATWTDYATAVTAAAAHGDGVSYILTPGDELAALDLDQARDRISGTIAAWAQRLLDQADHTYTEISPSGTGLRIWGTASSPPLQRNFTFEDGRLELFRRSPKALTVTGLQLSRCPQLGNIDRLIDRAVVWGERRKITTAASTGSGVSVGSAAQFSLEEIERSCARAQPPSTGNPSAARSSTS